MRQSERMVLDTLGELMDAGLYVQAGEILENVKNTIPPAYYRLYKEEIKIRNRNND